MKMIWLLIIGGWFSLGACLTGYAEEEYLLRVEMHGFEKSSEEDPEVKLLRGIEVVTRLNQTFHGKAQSGQYAQIMNGKLVQKEGKFALDIAYLHTFDDGTRVLGKPDLSKTGVESSNVEISLDKPVSLGGMLTESQTNSCPLVKSKVLIYVLLTRYEPKAEESLDKIDPHQSVIPELEDIPG
ncbi:hypothetical protein Pan153_10090 [Gimesia panareensis]|uniref:Lipoprotein n=1 Tax=Gimesia panareensis TaxID=2527978 RepID=A0A518FJ54_9PLAN|nr:hypothetical protein [Gimesia panareensis]QDV16382.1 hypothetical protein Pan153_10090 [Gimesia panareensis]